jgi:hypothetical protein
MDEVASITQVALIEPLAFIAPDAEEEANLNGIWKGRIISSEVYTSSGEESLGGNSLLKCRIPESGETKVDGALLGFMNGDNGSMKNNDSGTCMMGVNRNRVLVLSIMYFLDKTSILISLLAFFMSYVFCLKVEQLLL